MKYLKVYDDASFATSDEIIDEERVDIDVGTLAILRFENGAFEKLVVDIETSDENNDDAVEVEDEFYLIGKDRWTREL